MPPLIWVKKVFTGLFPVAVFALTAQFLMGCAAVSWQTQSDHVGSTGELGQCGEFFARLDQLTREAGVLDAGPFRVPRYPYLRVNRFLASFTGEVGARDRFDVWIDHMQALDREARFYEIANLPPKHPREELTRRVTACGNLLKRADFKDETQRMALRERINAPDEYSELRRLAGLYPLVGVGVSVGVARWHASARETFIPGQPVIWPQTHRYEPEPGGPPIGISKILQRTPRDALGIPKFTPDDLQSLFQFYGPIWEIEAQGAYDRIGAPYWLESGGLDVNTGRPVTYTHLSFTRFNGQIWPQLNYVIWFPERPKSGTLDLYGGRLDGLTYRVTLGADGRPWLYETMHNCGCYYKAYPTRGLTIRESHGYAEPPLVLKAPDLDPTVHRMVVAMASGTHYVQHLYPLPRRGAAAVQTYAMAGYGRLRSLPAGGRGHRSMFGQTGIAAGSQRLERLILWPTGVLSPGGMRQWGRHAVAFVGKRHFDDPDFMDRMFTLCSGCTS